METQVAFFDVHNIKSEATIIIKGHHLRPQFF